MPVPVVCATENYVLEINTAAIPAHHRDDLARGALAIVDLAFAQPGAEERYQAWLRERNGKKRRRARTEVHA